MKNIYHQDAKGFTLVELMITMVLAGLIVTAIYSAYRAMDKVYRSQQQVAEMQQNLRSAMNFLVRDIRMAGFDPRKSANAGFCVATQGQIRFTHDIDESGDTRICPGSPGAPGAAPPANTEEEVAFGFSAANDAGADGVADNQAAPFGRDLNGSGFQPIAENIAAVEFNYILDDATSTRTPSAAEMNRIDKVQVSMLARTNLPDNEYIDTKIYTAGSGAVWGPARDNFRRRLLITTIQCRNMGI